jgi:AraC-like DNA-binding protein
MKLERFLPSTPLIPFIREFLLIESDGEAGNKIIPDTSLVMAFRYRGSVQTKIGEEKEVLPASVITGLRKSSRMVYYSRDTSNLLVVFKEGGITALSGLPAHELFGLSVSSDNLFQPAGLQEVLERLAEAAHNRERIGLIEAFLLKNLIHRKQDLLMENAVRLIQQNSGLIRIKDLATSLHISQDPFEKRFRTLVGSTPKQYASIIRLRNLIKNYPSYSSLTAASYEAGYFDQSHFIKDFRQFTGETPKDFFQSARYW